MKRKISNQILSLLLALVMVFVMIPISTLTAISEDLTSITGISITGVPVPVVGERISPMDGSALTESVAHANKFRVIDNQTCNWKDEEGRAINYGLQCFEAGRTYSISFNIAPLDGYIFTDANIPVELYNLYPYQYSSSLELMTETHVVTATFTFELYGERTYDDISKFSFYQLYAPKDGDIATVMGVWAYNNSEMTNRYWTDGNGNPIDFNTKFVGGNSYSYNFEFTAFAGYKFADEVWIISDNRTVDWQYSFNNDKTKIYITIPYYVDSSDVVSVVTIDGMFIPTQGGVTRAWDSNVRLSVPNDANYTIPNQTKAWYEIDAEYSIDTQYKVQEKGFYAGKQYKMFLILHAKDGYKFAYPENVSFEFSGISSEMYSYTCVEAGGEDIIEVVITFTAQFPDGYGYDINTPAWCYSYIELKTALENKNIRYVALGDVEDMMPKIPHNEAAEPNGVDNVNPIVVRGKKDLNLLGDAVFSAPLSQNYDLKCFKELLILTDTYNADLYIHGPGSLTFNSSYLDFYYSVIKVIGGNLCVDGATIIGGHGNHTGFCYGINAIYGSVGIQNGATIRGSVYNGSGVCALSLGGEGNNQSLSVSIWDGNFYVDRTVEDGNHDHGLWVNNDCGLRIYGGTFDGIKLYRYAADNLGSYIQTGSVMTVGGTKTNPATVGNIDGKIVKVFKEVSAVDIHINSPVSNEIPSVYAEDVYLVPEGCTVEDVVWYENGQLWNLSSGNERFEAGSTYKIEITLSANDGIEFANPLTSKTINNKTAAIAVYGTSLKKGIVLSLDFGTCPAVVSEVNLNADIPKEQQTFGNVTRGDTTYSIYEKTWSVSDSGDDGTWTQMQSGDKFIEGKFYKLNVDLKISNNYRFQTDKNLDPDVVATVNGYTAKVSRVYEQSADDMICVEYKFGMCNDSVIEKLVVTDVVTPEHGEKPSYSCNLGGSGYKTYTDSDNNIHTGNGMIWWDVTNGGNTVVNKNDTFVIGHQYMLRVTLQATDGYTLKTTGANNNPDTTAEINGKTATVKDKNNASLTQAITYTFTCEPKVIKNVGVTDISAPVVGEKPDFTANVELPEYYQLDTSEGIGGIIWYDDNMDEMSADDTFGDWKQYRLTIHLIPTTIDGADTCKFYKTNTRKATATVNGATVKTGSETWDEASVAPRSVTIFYTFIKHPNGVFVSGSVTSFGDSADSVTIQLIPSGESEATYETTVNSNANYLFSEVAAGEYILKATKNGHITREYGVSVGKDTVIQNVQLHIPSDLTGDGKVDAKDLSRIYAHISQTDPLEYYEEKCGDVAGNDGFVNSADLERLYAHVNKTNPI